MARTDTLSDSPLVATRMASRSDIGAAVRAWVGSDALRRPLAVWGLTRLSFVLLTYFGVILFNSVLHGAHPSFTHQLLPAWDTRWDTAWYTEIAQRGYDWKKVVGTSPTAFFPLYPVLIRITVELTHRSYGLAALVVSNLAFLGALIYLWRLAAWELGRGVAGRTILYIAVFPTALFFFAGYTESLFLLLTVACFFHLRRQDWLLAGIFGGLASATRVGGVLLLLPFLYEYGLSRNFSLRRVDMRLLASLLIPAGLVAFMIYLQATVGNAWAFTSSQGAWQKTLTWQLWSGFTESFRQILSVQTDASFYQAHNLLNVGLGGLFLVCSVLAARRLPASYGLYLAAFWLVTLSSPAISGGYPVPLISLSRYVLALFPVFMYFGVVFARKGPHDAYLVLSVALLSLLTLQFINGGWVV